MASTRRLSGKASSTDMLNTITNNTPEEGFHIAYAWRSIVDSIGTILMSARSSLLGHTNLAPKHMSEAYDHIPSAIAMPTIRNNTPITFLKFPDGLLSQPIRLVIVRPARAISKRIDAKQHATIRYINPSRKIGAR